MKREMNGNGFVEANGSTFFDLLISVGFRSPGGRCVFLFLFALLSLLHSQEGYRWHTVPIGGGGFVSGIIAAPNDPNVFYARTDVGGTYRWSEASRSWIPLMDWVGPDERGLLGIDGIAVDPQVTGRVYMLAGTTYWNDGKSMFLRSDDYGDTWETIDVTAWFKAHGNGMGRANGERLAVDPNNSNIIFCGTRWNGLWKSTDRGATWNRVASLDVMSTPNEAGVIMVQFDPNTAVGGVTQTIYVGVSRENENLYKSTDGGATWSLIPGRPTQARIMPQRMALTPDGQTLYVTYGNGGGPHAHQWGGVDDWYNRGAVFKLEVGGGIWTDVSPVNFLAGLDSIETVHYGAYSGISIDPNQPNRILVSSINSWRGPQFWNIDGTWKDSWGDNIFVSEDGGGTWRDMFRYYWLDGGQTPPYNMVDENDMPWIVGNTVHWIGSAVIDPNNPDRAFVTSGNGIFNTANLWDFEEILTWEDTTLEGRATWHFAARGLEETVPLDLVSIPGGPMISVIGDYDGLVHRDITRSPAGGRHALGSEGLHVGTTTGIAYAAKDHSKLVKVANDDATYEWGGAVNPVHMSSDTGNTWQPASTLPPGGGFHKGKVALSADGSVIVWGPKVWEGEQSVDHPGLFRTVGGGYWTASAGIDFHCRPLADPENSDKFYAYDYKGGAMYVSTDGAQSFTAAGSPGPSSFKTARAAPGREGDIWVPLTEGGLARSTNSGTDFASVAGVTYCEAVGFGKEAPGAPYPAVYIYGTVGGVTGVFQSIDEGANWVRVNDDAHEYGGLANGEFVIGDRNHFGMVYMSTAGRGIAVRLPPGVNPVEGPRFAGPGAFLQTANGRLEVVLNGSLPALASIYNLQGQIVFKRMLYHSQSFGMAEVFKQGGVYMATVQIRGKSLQKVKITYLP